MNRDLQGNYITVPTNYGEAQAFLPAPLPPDPDIEWSPELREKFDRALLAVGRLDGTFTKSSDQFPESLFLYMYVRKEAVLSSMIEGTQSSLSDLLKFESAHYPGVPLDDVREVSNYVKALNFGYRRLSEGGVFSIKLLKEIHRILLSKGRGEQCEPGEFRTVQNWIGGSCPDDAEFVPPPPEYVQGYMDKLESFLQDRPGKTSALAKAAMAHVQFETIHPFLDGNGRLGRLMVTLLLCSEKLLRVPVLYLSLYFKRHRRQYYELLNKVRFTGDWEAWLDFFADAVLDTATQAEDTEQRLQKLSAADSRSIDDNLKRIAGSAHAVHKALLDMPISSPKWIQTETQLSHTTIYSCLRAFEKLEIVTEITGSKRNRLYRYTRYLEIMEEGTELPG